MSYTDLFFRRYRAALLEYLIGSGESGLAFAYEFGRMRMDQKVGPLQIVRVHQKAVKSILEFTPADDQLRQLIAAGEFLMEALSTFEMASRGYVDLVNGETRHRV
jgi:hypothetical protein